MRHYQALLRFDTTDPPTTPPGGEKPAVEYLKQVLEKEGIAVQTFALEPNRPNLVARLKGNGKKKPVLLMAHTDTVYVRLVATLLGLRCSAKSEKADA
jgi:acetylornithine deacetylase/succinyl-diaminopimelate desuccinylase-like protein